MAPGAHPWGAGMGIQCPDAAPAPTTACKQGTGGQERGRARAGEQLSSLPRQHKGGLSESQEHSGTLLHDQIPGERQGETPQPKRMLGLQMGRVGWLRNMTAKSKQTLATSCTEAAPVPVASPCSGLSVSDTEREVPVLT